MPRVLFCGSRDWTDEAAIRAVIDALPPDAVVVHGAAHGADTIAGRLARARGLVVEEHAAEWNVHAEGWCRCPTPRPETCKAAGARRNAEMMATGIDHAHAFPIPPAKGTGDMVDRLLAANVSVEIYERRLQVYTARVPHRSVPGYRGPDAFNITRRGGGERADPFAPSDPLLTAGLAAKAACKKNEARLDLCFRMYREFYLEEMRESYKRNHGAWRALLARNRVVVLCYCGTAHRCHRRTLAEILAKLGAVDCGEIST